MIKQYCEYCLQCARHYCGHCLERLSHTANMCYDVSDALVPAMFITNTEYCIQCLLHIVYSSNKVYAKFLVSLNSLYRIVEMDFIVNGILQIQSGPKKCIHFLLINIFGINLNEISISG